MNYENVEPYPVTVSEQPDPDWDDEKLFDFYDVQKMRFSPKKDDGSHKSTIIYNKYIKIENIPTMAYNYVVNGRSAIEWVMERYQVTVDKDSKILNDPNLWSREHRNPRYIFDLLLKVIRVSIESVKIVERME